MRFFLAMILCVLSFQTQVLAFEKSDAKKQLAIVPSTEDDLLTDICDAMESVFKGLKEIKFEKQVSKQSGAANLTALNDAGRKVVRNRAEVKDMINRYKKSYKTEPDLSRCSFMDNITEAELKDVFKK